MSDSALAKLEWATKHINELNKLFSEKRPFRFILETDVHAGKRSIFVKRDDTVIMDAAFIAADVVHNLRTALDHAYWEIVGPSANTAPERRRVQFPFSETAARLEEAIKNRLAERVSASFLKALIDLVPHGEPGGNELLYLIHDLDLIDKHRTPIPSNDHSAITSELFKREVPDFPFDFQTGSYFSNCVFDWLSHLVFLKGGILMGVVYQSPRQTGDIDFTAAMPPEPGFAEKLAEILREIFPRAAAEVGYPELMCNVQSIKYFPKDAAFSKNDGPAIKIKVGYAHRGSRQEAAFSRGQAVDALEVDISFREPVGAIQVVKFGDTGGSIRAYSLIDLIAEKYRALLQQEVRNRYRRQDIYDIDSLLSRFSLDVDEKRRLHALLLEKCVSRKIVPSRDALSQPEIIRRAKEEWETLRLEIGSLPDFDSCFDRVDTFYRSLPW